MVATEEIPAPIVAAPDGFQSISFSQLAEEKSKKRRLGHEDVTKASVLRSAFFAPVLRSQFLPCHLKMLKSLYSAENPSIQDGMVSEGVWDLIERYLDQSCSMQTAKKRAVLAKDIHDESLLYLSTMLQKKQTNQHRVQPRDMFSPLQLNVFSPPYEQTLQSHGRSSMNLIARLIGGIAAASQNKSESMAQPYLQVLEAVNGRLVKLKTILKAEIGTSGTADDIESVRVALTKARATTSAEIEIKIRLWQMLAIDLYNLVKENH